MRKKVVLLSALFTLLLGLMFPPIASTAAEQNARVTLPNFTVNLNGNIVDNQYREYPLLVYKDITYFPMTWYDSRLLGLATEWSNSEGLKINQSNVTSSYVSYKKTKKNSNSYNATIPTFKITVNGKSVDNSKEEYPLLSFNNVVYFPLTWKFAHDEFGWEYEWDSSTGLTVNSNNPQVKTVNLPEYAGLNAVAVFDGYYYFLETVDLTNNIYRVSENNIENKELVYSYETKKRDIFYKYITFMKIDNDLWFTYSVGGGAMGSDVYCKVNEDGKATVEHWSRLDFRYTPDGILKIFQGVPRGTGNLLYIPTGETNGRHIGDSNLLYGWYLGVGESRPHNSHDRSTMVIGEDVYVLGSSYPVTNGDINKIYKINLETNETVKITNFKVYNFKIINDILYYLKDEDYYLYSSNLDGTNEQKLSNNKLAINWFDNNWYSEIEGNVYYTAEREERGQYNLYRVNTLNEDTLVLKEPVERVAIVNDRIIVKLSAGEDYGVKVFDGSGNLILAITDQVSDVFAYKNQILLVSAEDKSIKIVELKE